MFNRLGIFVFVGTSIAASLCMGHSGGLDSAGGHHDRKNGGYHFHSNSPRSYTPTIPMTVGPRVMPRTSARTEARTTSRLSRYADKDREQARRSETPASVSPSTNKVDAHFVFHHSKSHPYDVVEFTDTDDRWRVLLTSSYHIRLRKDEVVRIEPTDDPRRIRTWIDQTGRYSVVAKYIDSDEASVDLSTMEHRELTVPLAKLSEYDRQHLQKIASSIEDIAESSR